MTLLKTSIYSSIYTAITFISGFILIKIVALKIGPNGIAQLGQYQNTTALLTLIATFSISAGVTKYIAEYKFDTIKIQQIVTTAITIVTIASIFTGFCIIVGSKALSKIAFSNTTFWQVYLLLGCCIFFVALNIVFSAILNGLNEIKNLTIINSSGAILGVILTLTLANLYEVKGVLIAANITAIFIFLGHLFVFSKLRKISLFPSIKKINKPILLLLFSYTLMNWVSGALAPLNQLFIRDYIIQNLSLQQAGYWQGISRISDYYLLFIVSVLSIYYLPTFSSIKEKLDLKKELILAYKIIMPIVVFLALSIFLCKKLVIKILFSKAFEGMDELFLFQLIGDVFKIGSWLLGYIMIAKAMTKTYIITEILFSVSLI
ncbi:MAG: O-antigen translocase, partial [Ferruginibacter sp.]